MDSLSETQQQYSDFLLPFVDSESSTRPSNIGIESQITVTSCNYSTSNSGAHREHALFIVEAVLLNAQKGQIEGGKILHGTRKLFTVANGSIGSGAFYNRARHMGFIEQFDGTSPDLQWTGYAIGDTFTYSTPGVWGIVHPDAVYVRVIFHARDGAGHFYSINAKLDPGDKTVLNVTNTVFATPAVLRNQEG